MFNPKEEYAVSSEKFQLRDFREYPDQFILRPPYQRHSGVWGSKMKQQFLDSLFRGYYIPSIVLRKIRMNDKTTMWEVIDGQQRISTILEFFDENSKLTLPSSLKDINPALPGTKYQKLSVEERRWIDQNLFLRADTISNIDAKENMQHLKIASDLFWRLQQGEPLSFIETLHSKLNSNVRNFVSRYADDYSFDFKEYTQIDSNKDKHPFFKEIIDINNSRMQHLLLLTRFLMIEFFDGSVDVGNTKLTEFFSKFLLNEENGEIDKEFLESNYVKSCLSNLNTFHQIYKNNPMKDEHNGVKYLKKDYFILSLYILLRHLKKYYVFSENEYKLFDDFSRKFYNKLIKNDAEDSLIMQFRDNRQQSKENLETRERIIRSLFFEENKSLMQKDTKRAFDESQKINIYVKDKGICKSCYEEFKGQGFSEEEAEIKAKVSWSEYDADHIIPWIKGGGTTEEEGQVLCKHHNRSKGGRSE